MTQHAYRSTGLGWDDSTQPTHLIICSIARLGHHCRLARFAATALLRWRQQDGGCQVDCQYAQCSANNNCKHAGDLTVGRGGTVQALGELHEQPGNVHSQFRKAPVITASRCNRNSRLTNMSSPHLAYSLHSWEASGLWGLIPSHLYFKISESGAPARLCATAE